MENENEKRKRSPNWLPSEKHLLLDLVEVHFGVIENKKSDGVTLKKKLAEWNKIEKEYNARTANSCRSANNLKAQWEYLKKAARKEAAENRSCLTQTGGGPPKIKKEDDFLLRVISLIKTTAVDLHNPFDSDSVQASGSQHISDVEAAEVVVEYMDIIDDNPPDVITPNDNLRNEAPEKKEEECDTDKDWGDYTPRLLQMPISTPLRVQEKTNTGRGEGMKRKTWVSRRRPILGVADTSLEQKKIDYYYDVEPEPGTSQNLKGNINLSPVAMVAEATQPESIINKPSHVVPLLQDSTNLSSVAVSEKTSIEKHNKSIPGTSKSNITKIKSEKTNKERYLYAKCRKHMKAVCQLRKRVKKLKNKAYLHELESNDSIGVLTKKLTPTFALLLQAQIKNKTKGRRWTTDEKITALRLFKRSPTCYRLMRRLFCLPAPSTLKSLLSYFSLEVGVNDAIFSVLSKTAEIQKPSDKTKTKMSSKVSKTMDFKADVH